MSSVCPAPSARARTRGAFRKIALGSWKTVGDPSVYGLLEFDASAVLRYSEQHKVSLTSIVGAALARVLAQRPEINSYLCRGSIRRRLSVDLFFQVNVPGRDGDLIAGSELKGVTVRNADKKSLLQIHQDLYAKARTSKKHGPNELDASIQILTFLPDWIMGWALSLSSWANYDLGLPLQWLGLPKDPFGSVMITNVGSLGVETAWAPLVPFSRIPLLLTVGATVERAWVVEGRVEVRPIVRIGVTFDHRLMDGVHAAEMHRLFSQYMKDPTTL